MKRYNEYFHSNIWMSKFKRVKTQERWITKKSLNPPRERVYALQIKSKGSITVEDKVFLADFKVFLMSVAQVY